MCETPNTYVETFDTVCLVILLSLCFFDCLFALLGLELGLFNIDKLPLLLVFGLTQFTGF